MHLDNLSKLSEVSMLCERQIKQWCGEVRACVAPTGPSGTTAG
jgi:hypothetical protein